MPRPLLASGEAASESRIRLGELTVNPFLNIGSLDAAERREAGEPPIAGQTTVWLTRADDGWALELEQAPAEVGLKRARARSPADAAEGDAEHADASDDGQDSGEEAEDSGVTEDDADADAEDGIVAHIPLMREAAEPQEMLSAVLVATSDDTGRFVLRWHDHRWSADFDLLPLPTPGRIGCCRCCRESRGGRRSGGRGR